MFSFKEKTKGFISGIVFASLLGTSLLTFADMQNIQAFFNDIKIQINGKIIDTGNDKPFVYNGRTYVPARYVAEGLSASVKWHETDNKIEINSNPVSNISNQENNNIQSNKKGTIKGSITWQYNELIGTKADVGAKVSLIPKNLTPNVENEIFCLLLKQVEQGKNGIYTTIVDGYGNYEMQDIPIGNYYLLVSSKNVNSNMNINQYDEQRLKPLFTDKGWQSMQLSLKLTKYDLKEIEIKENKTVTESNDFGNVDH